MCMKDVQRFEGDVKGPLNKENLSKRWLWSGKGLWLENIYEYTHIIVSTYNYN